MNDFTSLDSLLVADHKAPETHRIWPLVAELARMVPGLLLVGAGAFSLAYGLQLEGVL